MWKQNIRDYFRVGEGGGGGGGGGGGSFLMDACLPFKRTRALLPLQLSHFHPPKNYILKVTNSSGSKLTTCIIECVKTKQSYFGHPTELLKCETEINHF